MLDQSHAEPASTADRKWIPQQRARRGCSINTTRAYLPHGKVSRKKGNVATAITVTLELRALRSGVVLVVPNRNDALVVIKASWPGLNVKVRADHEHFCACALDLEAVRYTDTAGIGATSTNML